MRRPDAHEHEHAAAWAERYQRRGPLPAGVRGLTTMHSCLCSRARAPPGRVRARVDVRLKACVVLAQVLGAGLMHELCVAAERRELGAKRDKRQSKDNARRSLVLDMTTEAKASLQSLAKQHAEQQAVYTLHDLTNIYERVMTGRYATEDAALAAVRMYESEVQEMVDGARQQCTQRHERLYEPTAFYVRQNTLRLVCDLLQCKAGEDLRPDDHVLVQQHGRTMQETLDKLVLGALAIHCERLSRKHEALLQAGKVVSAQQWRAYLLDVVHEIHKYFVLRKRKESAKTDELQERVRAMRSELRELAGGKRAKKTLVP